MENKSNKISSIPFMFEKNIGQHNNEAKFVLKNSKGTIFFLESEIVFALMKFEEDKNKKESIKDKFINKKNRHPKEYEVNLLKIKLENANENQQIIGIDEFDYKISYFKGKDSSKWISDIPVYEKLIYKDVYQGIDIAYYENQGILEHDFIVNPYADINNIKISLEGADKIEKDQWGNILISVKENTVQILKPKAYQEIDNTKVEVESRFIIDMDSIKFNISSYDKSSVLVIDPPLLYGTYLGENSYYYGYQIAVDKNENAYITGRTFSTEGFPLKNAYQEVLKGYADIFLIKIDTKASGKSSLKYGTYLGGNGYEVGLGVSVDKNENAYITGITYSTEEFPLKNAYQEVLKGYADAFLVKIDTKASGKSSLKYGTYLGGNYIDAGNSVSVDANENAYITGVTNSVEEFPLKNAYQNILKGNYNAFLIKIDTKASGKFSLKYGTYLGGNDSDIGNSIAVDVNENVYITGRTYSTEEFPLKSAYQDILKGNCDAFLIKIDTKASGKSGLRYGTYLGGNNNDAGNAVSVDANENAYITGITNSVEEFPLKNAYQDILKGDCDVFLIKINTLVCDLVLEISTCKCKSYVGEKIPYTIKVTNKGPDKATNIVITDTLQHGLQINSFKSLIGNIKNLCNIVTWTISQLEVGQSEIAMIVVTSTNSIYHNCETDGGYIINTVSLTCDNTLINYYNVTDTSMTYLDFNLKKCSNKYQCSNECKYRNKNINW